MGPGNSVLGRLKQSVIELQSVIESDHLVVIEYSRKRGQFGYVNMEDRPFTKQGIVPTPGRALFGADTSSVILAA